MAITLQVGSVGLLLQGKQRRMFELIHRAGQAGITKESLQALLYAEDPNGGPESDSIVSVHKNKINAKLRDVGLQIASTRGHGALYRIEPL